MSVLDAFRIALEPPAQKTIADYAEENIRLEARVTNFPGPLRLDRTPYLRGVLKAFEDPIVKTIDLCFGAQTAKTTAMLAFLFYGITEDPGSALYSMPTEKLVKSFSKLRFQPVVEASPLLRDQKPADLDNYQTLEMQFKKMTLTFIGANSAGELSSRPIRRFFADEIDKFPERSRKEGSMLSLGIKRTTAFWNRKIVLSSTPTLVDGQIWQGLMKGDWREYHVPCPECGHFQKLIFENIRKPEDMKNSDEIAKHAWYECEKCKCSITNDKKLDMELKGKWIPKKEGMPEYEWTPPPPGGSTVSFHLPSWYAPWIKLGEVLARFRDAQKDLDELQVVINSDFAEPWEEKAESVKDANVFEHRQEYSSGEFPSTANIAAVILTADVQKDCLYYIVRAWGPPSESSWLTRYGCLDDFKALSEILYSVYSGFPITYGLIDSRYRTDEVYNFCREYPQMIPLMGAELLYQPLQWAVIDKYPATKIPIPGGLQRVTVNSAHYRGALFHRLKIRKGDPGYWALPTDTDETYTRQITSTVLVERKDKNGRLRKVWKQIRNDDHYNACEVYQMAGASILGIRNLSVDDLLKIKAAEAEKMKPKPKKERQSGWQQKRFPV